MATARKTASGAKKAPRLKNYMSSAADSTIFEAIRKSLASHGARRISFDYDDDGQASAISFDIEVNGVALAFKLPARLENVERLVAQSYRNAGRHIRGETLRAQAYKTAWANIRDWVAAQMALIESSMARTEEIFLPYLIIDQGGKTFFEDFAERRGLPSPSFRITEE